MNDNGTGDSPTEQTTSASAPAHSLPTSRISFPKQLEVLRAYAASAGQPGRSVSLLDVAKLAPVGKNTLSLGNAFLIDIGLLRRGDGGGFVPAEEVFSFQRAYGWNPETAVQKLAPLLRETWFAKCLAPRIQMRPVGIRDAIAVLAEVARADPKYEGQLGTLLEYLKDGGIVNITNGLIRPGPLFSAGDSHTPTEAASEGEETETETEASSTTATTETTTSISTAFANPTEGVVQFHVDVRVDMAEFASWEADRITAFFGGIAQVLAAKGKLEKQRSKAR